MAPTPQENLRVTVGQEHLELYQWHTQTAEHFFCRQCGTYTFHRRAIDPSQFAINVACLEGVDTDQLPPASLVDGASRP